MTALVLPNDITCHVCADLSGLVFFSNEDYSTSCVQFELHAFARCRNTEGGLNLPAFIQACAEDSSFTELKQQLLDHHFLIEY